MNVFTGVPILIEGTACLVPPPGTLMCIVVLGAVITQWVVIIALVIPNIINPLMRVLFMKLFLVV